MFLLLLLELIMFMSVRQLLSLDKPADLQSRSQIRTVSYINLVYGREKERSRELGCKLDTNSSTSYVSFNFVAVVLVTGLVFRLRK